MSIAMWHPGRNAARGHKADAEKLLRKTSERVVLVHNQKNQVSREGKLTKRELMEKLKDVYRNVWSLWDESEKMIDSVGVAPDELVEATSQVESAKVALMAAYQKLGGDVREL
jgi:flagellar hook-basal body complex protein FliE